MANQPTTREDCPDCGHYREPAGGPCTLASGQCDCICPPIRLLRSDGRLTDYGLAATNQPGHCPKDPNTDEYRAHRQSGDHAEWCEAGIIPATRPSVDRHFERPGDRQIPCPCGDDEGEACGLDTKGNKLQPHKVPTHKLTRRIVLEVSHSFSDMEAATARLAAIERDCSINKVLRERLRAGVARAVRNAGYSVANA